RYAWDYRCGRNIDCGAPLPSMVANECGAIACQRPSPRRRAGLPLWLGRLRLHTLRNKLRRTLRRLRQQLRLSLRASASGLRLTVQLSRRTVQLLTAFRDLLLRVPAALVLVICAAFAPFRRSSTAPQPSITRVPGLVKLCISFPYKLAPPPRKGFAPARPSLQAWSKIAGPSPSICSSADRPTTYG